MTSSDTTVSILHCDDPRLREAIGYVLANPGKQLRSQLTVASARLLAGEALPAATRVGTALEWLHSYSLVHDDLPAMDNDDLRRGKPTVHRQFDEATAILVGDGLQASAFAVIAAEQELSAEQKVRLTGLIANAVGFGGMVGGQALDMAAENQSLPLESLKQLHAQKTGALIHAAVVAGAICANASDDDCARLGRFAHKIGLAFQVTDDVLDVTSSSQQLGKTAGKDITANKSTYVSCLGLDRAKAEADRLLQEALLELTPYGDAGDTLRELAGKMVLRLS